MQFTGKGGKKFEDITREQLSARPIFGAPQHFAIVLDGEIKSFPQIDYATVTPGGISGQRRADHRDQLLGEAKDLALVLQTGALPVKFEKSSAPTSRRRSARTRCKQAQARGDRRPDRRRDLPAAPLPFPRPRRGHRPRHLRALPVRGDPPLQRHADAAGVRRPDPDDRRRRRRERRHLRTHQGRGARREVRARRDRAPATGRASTRSSTRTSSRASRHSCCSRSRPRSVKGFALMLLIGTVISLLTAVAATRAMLGLLAGFRWFDNPRFMGAHGTQGAEVAADRLHGPAQPLARDLRA